MPGFILHLTAAQMLLKHLPSHPDFPYPISSVNDFLIGNMRDEIATVYIKKSRTSIPFSRYLTEEYYYGDYTRMNTYLVNRYCIPLDLNPNVTNPGITEIQYENVQQVLDLLHHFLSVPPEAAQDLKVFPLEELLAALEQYVEEFLAVPNKYIP